MPSFVEEGRIDLGGREVGKPLFVEDREHLSPLGVHRILLVTSAWHMRRAARDFERQGFTVIPAPADFRSLDSGTGIGRWLPGAEALALSQVALKEYLGYWYESLRRD